MLAIPFTGTKRGMRRGTPAGKLRVSLPGLQAGLVSYWPLTEASGNGLDSFGSDPWVAGNAPGQRAGVVTNARDFNNASNHYFDIANNARISRGDTDWEFNGWYLLDALTSNVGQLGQWGTTDVFLLFHHASRFKWQVRNAADSATYQAIADALGAPSAGVWYNISCWHESGVGVGIRINDQHENTAAGTDGVNGSGAQPIEIGRYGESTALDMNGGICELGLWSRLLTAAERTYLYNNGSGRTFPF